MATYGHLVKRLDIRLVRGDGERVGGRWRRLNLATGETTPVDLSGWTGRVEFRSPDGTEIWYSTACDQMTVDGYAIAGIPYGAFTSAIWDTRRNGRWKCVVTSKDGNTTRTIGWGYWVLSD
ncbi:hypothetical protein [Bifidobacterium simiiventris]|uniref:hypothetical protein n=1 Tax=Bifidobacterium simiiventris TaxID=2834434 RepID=UPI001C57C7FE|nr:hypothetical protein [Bifidobacterium simiiventris]MBW3077682.1 hypothetical protein [Bifidobacterium simiiventris]